MSDDNEFTNSDANHSNGTHSRREDLDALMELAASGDRKALGAIARRLRARLLREALAVLGDEHEEAEDVVQDFFLSLLERERTFVRGKTPATAWARAIVRAMARHH
jgi:DNA-directed RNA polymerase specialized sigma24 family protein